MHDMTDIYDRKHHGVTYSDTAEPTLTLRAHDTTSTGAVPTITCLVRRFKSSLKAAL
jgi:hypothetical protein